MANFSSHRDIPLLSFWFSWKFYAWIEQSLRHRIHDEVKKANNLRSWQELFPSFLSIISVEDLKSWLTLRHPTNPQTLLKEMVQFNTKANTLHELYFLAFFQDMWICRWRLTFFLSSKSSSPSIRTNRQMQVISFPRLLGLLNATSRRQFVPCFKLVNLNCPHVFDIWRLKYEFFWKKKQYHGKKQSRGSFQEQGEKVKVACAISRF